MSVLLALGRNDIADYVDALFLVFLILIFAAILISWVEALGRMPYNRYLRAVIEFVRQVVNPYLNLFRRFIPPIGMFDLSPIVAIIVLLIVQAIVVGLIRG
jgi:YggT family protein